MSSAIRTWYEKNLGGTALGRAKKHVDAGAHAVRSGGESAIVGAGLGAAACYLKGGLDIPVDKAGKFSAPIDGALAAAGILGGVLLAHEDYGKDLANVGSAAAAVFSFRKSSEYLAAKLHAQGKTPGYQLGRDYQKAAGQLVTGGGTISGESGFGHELATGEDPITAASRLL